jgi:hypothetical protein
MTIEVPFICKVIFAFIAFMVYDRTIGIPSRTIKYTYLDIDKVVLFTEAHPTCNKNPYNGTKFKFDPSVNYCESCVLDAIINCGRHCRHHCLEKMPAIDCIDKINFQVFCNYEVRMHSCYDFEKYPITDFYSVHEYTMWSEYPIGIGLCTIILCLIVYAVFMCSCDDDKTDKKNESLTGSKKNSDIGKV